MVTRWTRIKCLLGQKLLKRKYAYLKESTTEEVQLLRVTHGCVAVWDKKVKVLMFSNKFATYYSNEPVVFGRFKWFEWDLDPFPPVMEFNVKAKNERFRQA